MTADPADFLRANCKINFKQNEITLYPGSAEGVDNDFDSFAFYVRI